MCAAVRLIWTSKPIRAAVGGYSWRRADSSNAVLTEVIFKLPDMNGFAAKYRAIHQGTSSLSHEMLHCTSADEANAEL